MLDRPSQGASRGQHPGKSREDARAGVKAWALRVIADRLENGEAASDLLDVSFKAA